MKDDDGSIVRMRAAVELAEATLLVLREHFRREHPQASDAELRGLVNAWLTTKHQDEFLEPGFRVRERPAGG